MAEREEPRRLTQHRLEPPVPETPVLPTGTAPPPSPASREAPALPPIPREASDLRLRERQRRWLEERDRFERSRVSRESTSEAK